MANLSDNTPVQGAVSNETPDSSITKSATGIIIWIVGFLFLLAIIWIIVRVASGAWHIGGK